MSAAGVAGPPPHPSSPASGPNGQPPRTTSFNGGEVAFPHIDDLKARALSSINRNVSIGKLFEAADSAFNSAKTNVDFRRPDLAFVEYLRAYEIIVEILPRHKDFTFWVHDQHGSQRLAVLQRKIVAMHEQFENIKKIIVDNNARMGTQSQQRRAGTGHIRSESDMSPATGTAAKVKPSPSPKPERLHARPMSVAATNGNGNVTSPTDILSDRFARLRGLGQGEAGRPASRASNTSTTSLPYSGTSNSDYGAETSGSTPRTSFAMLRPQGPRSMPENGDFSSRSSTYPLDTELAAAMPQAPPPTYSPARNMETTGNIAPPRHSARSLAGPASRKSSVAPISSSASAVAPNGGSGDYFPAYNATTTAPTAVPRRRSVHVPKERSIAAERLYDYLERFNILLIDFRSREDFDQGHIYARNVICIDPLIMQSGLSAEQLSDKLVLSPEEEQELFYNRDQFELVVCYDEETSSERYMTSPQGEKEQKLKMLQEALEDFNQDKPLQRPPILLIGGITAWVDLMGNQALRTSQTQARAKAGRPIQRRPLRRDGQISIPRRRVRDYNPLDADEEKKWRDRAVSESVPVAPVVLPDGANDELVEEDEDERYPSIEDFNARFPDASQLSPGAAPGAPMQAPPELPPKIPTYPTRPPPSVYPQVPTRPAPAAPRMSYTGVSDRSASQSTPTPRTSSALTPYVPPKYLASNLRLPRTGLYNFGSTCYMNATLQALSATTPLSIMFLDDGFKSAVQKDNWKGSRGLLPEIYSNVIRNLWNGDSSYIKPSTLRSFCGRLNATFSDPNQQQDAQEFFSFLVDCLHEDFNGVWSRSPLRPLTDQEEAKRERMPKLVVAKMEWSRWLHRDSSCISTLLYGQLSSRVRCPKCATTSTQYEAWAGLQIEIPDRREALLQDCLREHFSDELLDDENQWTCPTCKVPRRASKKLTITRLPPFLVITLRRFRTERQTQRKLHTHVRFPLNGLDMSEFVVPPPSPSEAQQILAQYGPEGLNPPDSAQVPPFIYDAYAVVQHHGQSTRSGHYTCAAKDPARGCWRLFNDTTPRDFHPPGEGGISNGLDNDLAYMVFYQRRRQPSVEGSNGQVTNGHGGMN